MHQLRDEANQAQNAIDDFERYLLSLKADSEESLQCIKAYYEKLRDAESNVRDINLEAVDNRYKGAIDHLYGLLDSAYKVLSHTPIDVYKLDSLIAEIKGSGDEVVANILNDKTKMALAEAAIVFANRDRNHLGEVDTLLQQTEGLYFSGDFNRSYEETLKELKRRHAGE
jgi:septation ring formation regulator EzrA